MLSDAEAKKVRSELSRIRVQIEEIENKVRIANDEIAQARDEIEEENDVLSSKGENQAFYSVVSCSLAKLTWELDKRYAARIRLIAELEALREYRSALHDKLYEG